MIYQGLDTALCVVHPHLIFVEKSGNPQDDCQIMADNLAYVIQKTRKNALIPLVHTWMSGCDHPRGADVWMGDYGRHKNANVYLESVKGTEFEVPASYVPDYGERVFMSPNCSAVPVMKNWLQCMQAMGIKRLLLVGYYTDECVLDHATDLMESGFQVGVIQEATIGYNPERTQKGFAHLQALGVNLVKMSAYENWLENAAKSRMPIKGPLWRTYNQNMIGDIGSLGANGYANRHSRQFLGQFTPRG